MLQLLPTMHDQHHPLLIVCCLNHELLVKLRFLIYNSLEQEDVRLLPAQPAACQSSTIVLNQKGHCHFPKGQGEGRASGAARGWCGAQWRAVFIAAVPGGPGGCVVSA